MYSWGSLFWGSHFYSLYTTFQNSAIVYRGYIGIMENKKETDIVCTGYIGIMENRMETTIIIYRGYRNVVLIFNSVADTPRYQYEPGGRKAKGSGIRNGSKRGVGAYSL